MSEVKGRVANEVEVVAIYGAFKETSVKAAKAKLREGAKHQVRMTVEIVGAIAKSPAIDPGTMIAPPVDLTQLPTICALLKKLGVGEKRLKTALLHVGQVEETGEPDKLATVFVETAREIASSLPQIPSEGKSPRVESMLSVRVLESSMDAPAPAAAPVTA